jgi:hypothetical protein
MSNFPAQSPMSKPRQFIKTQIGVPIAVKRERGGFIFRCEPLNLFSQGKTEAEALKDIRETVGLFVEPITGAGY